MVISRVGVPVCGTPFRFRTYNPVRTDVNEEPWRWPTGWNCAAPTRSRDGAALKVETGGLTLAVFNVDGEFYVIDDTCTHGPGSLSEGYIEGDVVECNFHNGQFNIRTGEVVLPPCMVPVKTYPAVVEDGKVVIEV